MKKFLSILLSLGIIGSFALFAVASVEDDGSSVVDQGSGTAASGESDTVDQGSGDVDGKEESDSADSEQESESSEVEDPTVLGDYQVEIVSCRLAESYDDKPCVIVKYNFTNNSDDATSFMFAIEHDVYQDGIGLNSAVIIDESVGYSSDNQMKDIKQGSTLEVEVAYELNDTTTDIDVEVSELISFSDKTITKTFSIQ